MEIDISAFEEAKENITTFVFKDRVNVFCSDFLEFNTTRRPTNSGIPGEMDAMTRPKKRRSSSCSAAMAANVNVSNDVPGGTLSSIILSFSRRSTKEFTSKSLSKLQVTATTFTSGKVLSKYCFHLLGSVA